MAERVTPSYSRAWIGTTLATAPIRWLAAHDLFISYKRDEARDYALALANRLNERRRISCAIDRFEARPGRTTPARVLRHARWSRARLVLATPGALSSKEVAGELAQIHRYPGPLLVIAQPGVLLCDALWHEDVIGVDPVWERGGEAAFRTGQPSQEVIEAVLPILTFMLRERRILVMATSAAVLSSASLLGVLAFKVQATQAKSRAEEASVAAVAAGHLASMARASAASAAQAASAADTLRIAAESRASDARREVERETAKLARVSANLGAAERRAAALSLGIAAARMRQDEDVNWRQFDLQSDKDPTVIAKVLALAAESEHLSPNTVAEELLRDGIALMPVPAWRYTIQAPSDFGWSRPHVDVDPSGHFLAAAVPAENGYSRLAVLDLDGPAEVHVRLLPAICALTFVAQDLLAVNWCDGANTVELREIARGATTAGPAPGSRPASARPGLKKALGGHLIDLLWASGHVVALVADVKRDGARFEYENGRVVFWPLFPGDVDKVIPMDAPVTPMSPFKLVPGGMVEVDRAQGRIRYWEYFREQRWTRTDWYASQGCAEVAGSRLMMDYCPSPDRSSAAIQAKIPSGRLPVFASEVVDFPQWSSLTAVVSSVGSAGAEPGQYRSVVTVVSSPAPYREHARIIPGKRVLAVRTTEAGVLTLESGNTVTLWHVPKKVDKEAIARMSPEALVAAVNERLVYSISAAERAALLQKHSR